MIKEQHVRIGNTVLYRGDFYNIAPTDYAETDFDLMNPIPLTPEILKSAGFDGYAVWSKNYVELEYGHFSKCFQFRWNNELLTDIHYLHQLQNLFYSLCGEELTVNL